MLLRLLVANACQHAIVLQIFKMDLSLNVLSHVKQTDAVRMARIRSVVEMACVMTIILYSMEPMLMNVNVSVQRIFQVESNYKKILISSYFKDLSVH